MSRLRPGLIAVALVILAVPVLRADASDTKTDAWPTFRGPAMKGAYTGDVIADSVGLEVAWKRALGSGYSSVSLVGGRGVTLFTDGENDVLTAFDAATGAEIWRTAVNDMYAGHSGSDDGPIGTPTIHDGMVYVVGPRGDVLAVRLEDGGEVWRHQLTEADSSVPTYGYSTTPVVHGDAVIVETGGADGHGVTAYGRLDGKKLWSSGSDTVNHQSPILASISGREQLLTATDTHLRGLDPATGEELWSQAHGVDERYQGWQPIEIGEGRFLANFGNESIAYKITSKDGGYAVEELWRGNAFRRSYALPILHDGYLYGYANRYLSCVDPEDGKVMWRTRELAGLGLILVDGHLVVLSQEGEVVLARANPQGYDERARLKVFERGNYAPPSYANGHVYVRNLADMAAVKITDVALASAEPEDEEAEPPRGVIAELAARVAAADSAESKKAAVDAFMAAQESFPIHEDGGLVHLVFREEGVEDVAVTGNLVGGEVPLQRLAGTDFFWASFERHPKGHFEYAFSVNFGDRRITDPLNPFTVATFQEFSELRMPEWPEPTHLNEPEGPRGAVDSFQFRSEILDNVRQVHVYMPPGYARSQESYPVLFVHNGDGALREMKMDNTLDNLIHQERIQPLIAVFVPRANGGEYGGPQSDDYVRMITEELLPHVERHYRADGDAAARGAMGVGSGGLMSFYTAFKQPGTFARVASQSFYMRGETAQQVLSWVAAAEAAAGRYLVEWSHNDYDVSGIDAAADSKALIEALKEKGFNVKESEVWGAPGHGSWRGQTDDILEHLYPPVAAEASP